MYLYLQNVMSVLTSTQFVNYKYLCIYNVCYFNKNIYNYLIHSE